MIKWKCIEAENYYKSLIIATRTEKNNDWHPRWHETQKFELVSLKANLLHDLTMRDLVDGGRLNVVV